jgi:hypothetical protein
MEGLWISAYVPSVGPRVVFLPADGTGPDMPEVMSFNEAAKFLDMNRGTVTSRVACGDLERVEALGRPWITTASAMAYAKHRAVWEGADPAVVFEAVAACEAAEGIGHA